MTITTYFNELRARHISVLPEDTVWIDTFLTTCEKEHILSKRVKDNLLLKSLSLLKEGQTTKDVINLFRQIKKIDFTKIDEAYQISLTKWKDLLNDLR